MKTEEARAEVQRPVRRLLDYSIHLRVDDYGGGQTVPFKRGLRK